MSSGEIFRDWWQTIAALASAIGAVLPLWLNKKRDRNMSSRARRMVASILLGTAAVSFVLWQVSAREAAGSNNPGRLEQQVNITGSNSGGVQQIVGPVDGSVLVSDSTQTISNTTNVDDHRSQSPTLNNSSINTGGGDATFGNKISRDGSGNNISNTNGKVIIHGSDNSTTYNINQYYNAPTNAPFVPETKAVVPKTPSEPTVSPTHSEPGLLFFPFGQTQRIEFTAANKSANIYKGSYYLDVEQGDKLAFDVSSVKGAELKITVRVFVDGKGTPFESSKLSKSSVHWIMQKGIPGTRARFEIKTENPGAMDVRVDKVK